MFSEIVNSIKANLYERIVSPLSGAFLIALLLSNYETVLLVFDSQDYYQKMSFISETLYPDFEAAIYKLFCLPALFAVGFIVVYPWPSRWAYQYWMGQQKRLKEIKVKIENETPLTIQESRELRRQLAVLEDQFNTEIRQKEKEIEDLKASVVQLENEKSDLLSDTNEPPGPDIVQNEQSGQQSENNEEPRKFEPIIDVARDDAEDSIEFVRKLNEIDTGENLDAFLRAVGSSSSGDLVLRFLPSETGLSPMRTEHIAKGLADIGFAEIYTDNDGDKMFFLSPIGKRFLLDHKYA